MPPLHAGRFRTIRTHRNNDVRQLQTQFRALARWSLVVSRQFHGIQNCTDILVGRLSLALGRHYRHRQATMRHCPAESSAGFRNSSGFESIHLRTILQQVLSSAPGAACWTAYYATDLRLLLGLRVLLDQAQQASTDDLIVNSRLAGY